MSVEKSRLTQSLGMPDLKLKEIVEERRLLDAASRWPILNDLVRGYEPAPRSVSVNLHYEEQAARQEHAAGIIRLKTKGPRRSKFANGDADAGEAVHQDDGAEHGAEEATQPRQLSNVFLRLKHRDKPVAKAKSDNKLVTV